MKTRYNVLRAALAAAILALVCGMSAPAPAHAQDDVTWLLNQINTLRGGLGLHAYSLNPQLTAAATQHSQYMADSCDVSHTQANGSTPLSRARANGYTGGWISENIYSGPNARASDAWNFWINSGIHYQGLTHKIVNEIGIGVAAGSCGRGYTLLFGHRADVTAPPAPAPAGDSAPAAPPPTRRPTRPPATFTPTPTIPTLTPSHTWTVTPTPSDTPAVTGARVPPETGTPSATPLLLPTVPALDSGSPTPVVIARLPSNTPTLPATATGTPTPTPLPTPAPAANGDNSSRVPGWMPVMLVAGAVMLGAAGVGVWRYARR